MLRMLYLLKLHLVNHISPAVLPPYLAIAPMLEGCIRPPVDVDRCTVLARMLV